MEKTAPLVSVMLESHSTSGLSREVDDNEDWLKTDERWSVSWAKWIPEMRYKERREEYVARLY